MRKLPLRLRRRLKRQAMRRRVKRRRLRLEVMATKNKGITHFGRRQPALVHNIAWIYIWEGKGMGGHLLDTTETMEDKAGSEMWREKGCTSGYLLSCSLDLIPPMSLGPINPKGFFSYIYPYPFPIPCAPPNPLRFHIQHIPAYEHLCNIY